MRAAGAALADPNRLSGFESGLVRLAAALLSRSGRAASLVVMIYHRVLEAPDPLLPGEPDAPTFAAQIKLIAKHFNVLGLRDAAARLRSGSLPARTVCITFDDGYANNSEIAAPILAEHGVPATMFIATGYLNGGRMFNDTVIEAIRRAPQGDLDLREQGLSQVSLTDAASRIRAAGDIISRLKYLEPSERVRRADRLAEHIGASLPDDLMMTDAQVRKLAGLGFEIGAHTVNHPILASVDEAAAWTEITQSRQRLEELTGAGIPSFAYPNGKPLQDYRREHVALVRKAGFEVAVSTAWGAATGEGDALQIPRIAPWDKSARRYAARMVRAYRQRHYVSA